MGFLLWNTCGNSNSDKRTLSACQTAQNLSYSPNLFKEGDLVFRRGSSLSSTMVLLADRSTAYSHVGMLLKDSGKWKVVHASPDEADANGNRVVLEDLLSFWSVDKAIQGCVMRSYGDSLSLTKICQYALWFSSLSIPFDHNFNLKDTNQMYCTELMLFLFSKANMELTNGNLSQVNLPGIRGMYVLPSDIQNGGKLRWIYSFCRQ